MLARPIESARINGAQPEQIQEFYNLVKRVQRKANIRVENSWNMDESSIALGACINLIAIGDASKKNTFVQSPNNREWVSIVESVSALGRSIRPLIIFKGKHPQSTWFHQGEVPNWIYTTSKNGWIANRITFRWLTKVFLPETKPPSNEARLLILDGHASHHSIEFLLKCKQNNVWLVFLPPHSTHVLQPLDLSCFSAVKSKYREQIADLASLNDAAPIKKHRFIKYYHKAREEGLTARTIKSGWRTSGIYPWNPRKGLKSSLVKNKAPIEALSFKQANSDQFDTIATPKKPRDMYQMVQSLHNDHTPDRKTRLLLQKVSR